ncbi:MAG: amidase [Mesorhizobium sp.]|uniref:amidase n=1 Tax=unclassified Mesorhizobium TaxID=325217 RepID=UPI000F761136|nr:MULTISPECIES: amidase family protein [unclassified Mesorhizobium]AZN98018.1 amidase [Mesorhizobium sp. M9A.F.Ca.ET.002.03.1.2]AZO19563.1 amidase [Mesorhizobium sp. M1E.F.Ca.ET.045.02.1.1]RWB65702.1 MAG: amidase [Mesorhizobium sp.]RWJ38150.1 MAG: amidase [Mesorhizobium sp.]RWJ78527.1 MAG: amidase [Mesorhizobium sp.]
MTLSEYTEYDATGLASLVRRGEVSPLELTRLAREAHDEVNSRINAVIEFYADAETVTGADEGIFHGVPFFRKDVGATETGRLQERGSRLFKGCRADTDSYFFRRAQKAGLRTIGRTRDASFGRSRQFVVCRTVRDMAAALDVFSGPHPGDPFIIVQPNRPYREELSRPTGKLRVGLARTKWGTVDLDPEVVSAVESTASLLEEMGHLVTEVEPPYASREYTRVMLAGSSYFAISLEEAAQTIGREINAETLEPINLKIYEYGRSSQRPSGDIEEVLRRLRFRVGEAVDPYDILLTPTMPMVALPHGGIFSTINPTLSAEEFKEADAALYQYTGVFNVTGQPSVSLPVAQSTAGLPIGIQIVGRFGDEATLVRVARDIEEARPWKNRLPDSRAGRRRS